MESESSSARGWDRDPHCVLRVPHIPCSVPHGMMPILNSSFCLSRSWDLNKICYKSGVPIIENGMIERVSGGGHGMTPRETPPQGIHPPRSRQRMGCGGNGVTSPRCCKGTINSMWEDAGLGSPAGLGVGGSRASLTHPC